MVSVLFLVVNALLLSVCTAQDYNGFALLLLRDFDFADLSRLGSRRSDFLGLAPHVAPWFRNASPDLVASQASYLTGRLPARLGIAGGEHERPTLGKNRLTLFNVLRQKGYQVAHFGEWGFADDISTMVDHYHISSDSKEVADAAIAWLQLAKLQKTPFFLSVFWPNIDVAFEHGQTFSPTGWNNGVKGVANDNTVCRDVLRGDNEPRYNVCPRQIYLSNRVFDFVQVNRVLKQLKTNSKTLAMVASASGLESPQVDGHADGNTARRGGKRSLYEGGIKTVLRYGSYGVSLSSSSVKSFIPLNSMDILPTVLDLVGIPETFYENEVDGVNVWKQLQLGKDLVRTQPQVWEYRFQTPGHCMHDSPRFAILDDTGEFKLLIEPGPDGHRRKELYQITRGNFELVNWYDAVPSTEFMRQNLQTLITMLQEKLEEWIDEVTSMKGYEATEHEGCVPLLKTEKKGSRGGRGKELRGIVSILTDDLGFGDVSFGKANKEYTVPVHFDAATPNIDALAEQGVALGNFYASSSVCSPTRAAILTGRYPSHRMVKMHAAINPNSKTNSKIGGTQYLGKNAPNLICMPELFRRNGWITGHFGKWHLGFSGRNLGHESYGFDEYQVYAAPGWGDDSYTPYQFPTATQPHPRAWDNYEIEFSSYSSEAIVNRSIAFISDRVLKDEKFFVNVWLQVSHAPLNLYQGTRGEQQVEDFGYPKENNPYPGREDKNSMLKNFLPHQVYATFLASLDRSVGKLVDFIDNSGIGDSTLIMFTSDNGPELEEFFFIGKGSTSPFRGKKRSLYDGGIHVPAFFRWTNSIPKGGISLTPASTIDLYPTFATLAELNTSLVGDYSTVQGKDISCQLFGDCSQEPYSSLQLNERVTFFEFRENYEGDCLSLATRFAARYKDFKWLMQPDRYDERPRKGRFTREELYNITADPFESTNLLVTRPGDAELLAVRNLMRTALLEYTDSDDYDISVYPSGMPENKDAVRSNFQLTEECDPDSSTPSNLKALTIETAL